ncbi:MAG: hypothetical protein H7A37_05420 [Chlamydiales bacterium]|nr:hypothetical protein [Chlamydiia bacterium]MCP5507719.1 hypothetical protein [Chlamydiales bacterium]
MSNFFSQLPSGLVSPIQQRVVDIILTEESGISSGGDIFNDQVSAEWRWDWVLPSQKQQFSGREELMQMIAKQSREVRYVNSLSLSFFPCEQLISATVIRKFIFNNHVCDDTSVYKIATEDLRRSSRVTNLSRCLNPVQYSLEKHEVSAADKAAQCAYLNLFAAKCRGDREAVLLNLDDQVRCVFQSVVNDADYVEFDELLNKHDAVDFLGNNDIRWIDDVTLNFASVRGIIHVDYQCNVVMGQDDDLQNQWNRHVVEGKDEISYRIDTLGNVLLTEIHSNEKCRLSPITEDEKFCILSFSQEGKEWLRTLKS